MMRLLLFSFLLLTGLAWAQDETPSPSPTPNVSQTPIPNIEETEHPAHGELRLLRQHMEDAMNAQDIDSLLDGVASDVVFTTMNDDVVRGKDEIRSYFQKMMKGPDARVKSVKTHFEVDELTILYSGTDNPEDATFGIAYGHSNDEYTLADKTRIKVQPRWSAALIRDRETWKVANFHYSVNMFDNPVLSKLKGMLALVGGAGLVLGLGIGFFVGRRKS